MALLRASHLPPTLAVTAIATSLAVSVGRGAGAIAVAAAVLAGQLTVGWSNDFIDRERDRAAGRLGKPIVSGAVGAGAVRRAAIIAGVACVPLSMLSGWRAGSLHLLAVGAALAYNLWFKATLYSPLPYIVAFGALPAFVTLGLAGHPWPPWWAFAAGAGLGCGAHFINTLGDIDDDIAQGVVGLPQRLGSTRSMHVGVGLLALATTGLTFAPPGRPSVAVLVLFVLSIGLVVAVALAARCGRSHLAWPLTIVTAVSAVVVLLANGSSLA